MIAANNKENISYWEEFDGQSTEGFDTIGITPERAEPIGDTEAQMKEFHRIYGKNTPVYIYKLK